MSGDTHPLLAITDESHSNKSRSNRRTRSPQTSPNNAATATSRNKFGTAGSTSGPRVSRRHTTTQEGSTSRNSSVSRSTSTANRDCTSPDRNSGSLMRRSITLDCTGTGTSRSHVRHGSASLLSESGSSLVDKSGEIWQHCPATVSSISKPSLMEKLQQDATKFRGTCPLPSIMGDSIESGTIASGTVESGTATNCTEEGKSSQEEDVEDDVIISDSEEEEDEKEKAEKEHDNFQNSEMKDPTKLSGLLQFDPSKTDHLKVVRTPSTNDESIFAMDKSDHETVALPKGSNLGDSLKKMGESQDTLPPLVDDDAEEQMTEAEDINSLFSATWSAGFSLTSDNALGHKDELETPRNSLLGEPYDDEETEEDSLADFKQKEKGTEEQEEEDDACSSSSESISIEASEAETDSFVEEDHQRPSNASQALLQFNHVSPDGLDFATCQRDDTSIFQMDSNSTMDVPALNLESELDKKLKQVGSKAREKRGSLFGTKLLEKAKSFKRPKALMEKALTRAESVRVAAALLPSSDAKGKDTTVDHTTADDSASKTQSTSYTEDINPSTITIATQSDLEGKEGSIQKDESNIKRLTDNSTEKSNPRRRRERARRESVRDKGTDTQEGERKERQRKRDALRKATSSRNMGDGLSPKKRGSARRRSTKTGDVGHNSVPHINTDLSGEGNKRTSPSSGRRHSTRTGELLNSSIPYLETDWKRENHSKSSVRRRNTKTIDVGNSSIPHLDSDWKQEGNNKTHSSSGRRRKIDIGNSSVPHLDIDQVGEGYTKTASSSGRRRGSGNKDAGNSSVLHLDIDQLGESNNKMSSTSGRRRCSGKIDPCDADQNVEGKTPASNDGKESRRRSTIRKSLSSRNLMPGRPSTTSTNTGNSGAERRSVRRTHSSDDGTSGRRSSNRRRASKPPPDSRRRSRSRARKDKKDLDRSQGKGESRRSRSRARMDKSDLDRSQGQADEKCTKHRRGGERGESDLDRSSKRGDEKRRRSDRRSVDAKRTSRASRQKTKESGGNENDMDKSKESQNGTRNRRRSSKDRKQMRRSRRSRDEKASDAVGNGNKGSTDPENNPNKQVSGSSNDDKEPPRLERGPSARLNNSFTKMNLFGDDAKEGGEAELSSSPRTTNLFEFENDTKEKEFKPQAASSSLRIERSFDSSFSDLAAAHEGIGGRLTETFHNDLGAGETDRRKSFIKSISVRISAKQTTLGKGARNLIIGGSKTEKQRLLDIDDESVISS